MKSSLFDFFPVPKTLAMHTSGVAVSDDYVQFVRFSSKNNSGLEDFGEVEIPENVLEEGGVVDAKAFTDILSEFRKKHKLNLVEVSIPEEKSYLFKASVLGDSLKEIRNNIELQIQENVPFKLSEVVFDFSFLSEKQKDGKRDVVVSVLPRTVADQYISVFKKAGFTLISFQVESQAVTQAVVARGNKGTVLVVNLDKGKAWFYIVTGQTVRFSSTVSLENNSVGIVFGDIPKVEKDGKNESLTILTRETRKIITYWETHDGSGEAGSIQKVYIVGNIEEETKTTDYMSAETSLPVEIANVWVNASSFDEAIPDMQRKDSLRFAAATGLALPNQE